MFNVCFPPIADIWALRHSAFHAAQSSGVDASELGVSWSKRSKIIFGVGLALILSLMVFFSSPLQTNWLWGVLSGSLIVILSLGVDRANRTKR